MELKKEQLYATGAGSGKSHGHEKGPSHMANHKYNAQDYGRAPRAPLLARSSDTWRVRGHNWLFETLLPATFT